MIAVNLLVACGFEKAVKRVIRRPFEALFRLNGNLACAFALGTVAGYPQGAQAICRIYDKGGCTKEEAEQALCFCCNCSPAFAIGVIGGLLNNLRCGVMLFCLQLAVSIGYGIITRPRVLSALEEAQKKTSFSLDILPRAVTDSVIPMLNICAYVISFAFICNIVTLFDIPAVLKQFVYSLLELTNAVSYIIKEDGSLPLLGFALVFSGLCVHAQSYSVIMGRFSMKKYFVGKSVQACVTFFILYLQNL